MQREAKTFLSEIQQSCLQLAIITAGKTLDDYANDRTMRGAVAWEFTMIGENMGKLLKIAPEIGTSIPEARKIVDFRNVLVHGYSGVAHDAVWDALTRQVPQLLHEVNALLAEE